MICNSVSLLYFSPTGSCKNIAESFAKYSGLPVNSIYNITTPKQRNNINFSIPEHSLLIVCFPVYEEFIPDIILPTINNIKGNGQAAILISVYGNIGFGMSLMQMYNIFKQKGFSVKALFSFIGEHSFKQNDFVIAKNRPDKNDLEKFKSFMNTINEKIKKDIEANPRNIPSSLPLMAKILPKGSANFFTTIPKINEDQCKKCFLCEKTCPSGAINPFDLSIDDTKCLRCFSCVQKCPAQTIEIKFKKSSLVKTILRLKSRARKVPEIYF